MKRFANTWRILLTTLFVGLFGTILSQPGGPPPGGGFPYAFRFGRVGAGSCTGKAKTESEAGCSQNTCSACGQAGRHTLRHCPTLSYHGCENMQAQRDR